MDLTRPVDIQRITSINPGVDLPSSWVLDPMPYRRHTHLANYAVRSMKRFEDKVGLVHRPLHLVYRVNKQKFAFQYVGPPQRKIDALRFVQEEMSEAPWGRLARDYETHFRASALDPSDPQAQVGWMAIDFDRGPLLKPELPSEVPFAVFLQESVAHRFLVLLRRS